MAAGSLLLSFDQLVGTGDTYIRMAKSTVTQSLAVPWSGSQSLLGPIAFINTG